MLVQAIPAYRLPREELGREISMIVNMGVTLRDRQGAGPRLHAGSSSRSRATRPCSWASARPQGASIGIPGEDGEGVADALRFLSEYNVNGTAAVGKKVAVIGGGNSAIDAARTALRLGAESVTILYRRHAGADAGLGARRSTPPTWKASPSCRWWRPRRSCATRAGKVTGVLCQQQALGDYDKSGRRRPVAGRNPDFTVECDQVIAAIGQSLDVAAIAGDLPLESAVGLDQDRPAHRRAPVVDWVFAGGDAATGPASWSRPSAPASAPPWPSTSTSPAPTTPSGAARSPWTCPSTPTPTPS